ncbi:MAG: hypothetical protein QW128_00035 [Thermoprotei archaeon]
MEEERKPQFPFIILPLPIPDLYELIIKYWPKGSEESLKHLINANIEFLKAIESILNNSIKKLETMKTEIEKKEEKRERTKVE